MAILESLAYGLPSIVTPGCRMPEVAQGMGWCVEPAAFAQAIASAAYLPDETYRMLSNRAMEYIRINHDWQENGTKMGAMYRRFKPAKDAREQPLRFPAVA
jgi:glycosyltransferase involved in cell wall biosynthesis